MCVLQFSRVPTRWSAVENVSEYIDNKCKELYVLGRNAAIDERKVGFKVRIQFKCYNPKKHTKWDLRLFLLMWFRKWMCYLTFPIMARQQQYVLFVLICPLRLNSDSFGTSFASTYEWFRLSHLHWQLLYDPSTCLGIVWNVNTCNRNSYGFEEGFSMWSEKEETSGMWIMCLSIQFNLFRFPMIHYRVVNQHGCRNSHKIHLYIQVRNNC